MKTFAIAILISFTSAQEPTDPKPPVWPKTFMQTFDESVKYPFILYKTTKGTYYYDVSDPNNMLTRIDRDNGIWDPYCGLTHHLTDQPCNQYISKGDRYIHYPKDDTCCYCCSENHGCGVLKNDWISDSKFDGERVRNGVSVW